MGSLDRRALAHCCWQQGLRVPALVVASLCLLGAASTQTVTSTLTGLQIGARAIEFGVSVRLDAEMTRVDAPTEWPRRGDRIWLRVHRIDGVELPPTTAVWARTLAAALGADPGPKEGDWLQLDGSIEDAFDFGGATHLAVVVAAARPLRGAEVPNAPTSAELDLGALTGRVVELRCRLWSQNGAWWLDRRDEQMLPLDRAGRRRSFPTGWHGHRVQVRGRLERQLRLPANLREDKVGLRPEFVLLDSEVTPCSADPDGESGGRFRQLCDASPRLRDGVFDLLPGGLFPGNYDASDTAARDMVRRNWPWLQALLADDASKTRDVVAARIADAARPLPLRLVYAGVLAAHDDERGRAFLREQLSAADEGANARYVLGAFATWRTGQRCSEGWCEPLALQWLRAEPRTTALQSDLPDLLVRIGSRRGVAAMIELLVPGEALRDGMDGFWPTLPPGDLLCDALLQAPPALVSNEALLEIARTSSALEFSPRRLAGALLRRDVVDAVDVFLPRLAEDHWDGPFFDDAGASVLAELERRLPTLDPPQRGTAEWVLRMRAADAVPRTLAMLADPSIEGAALSGLCYDLRLLDAEEAGAVPAARALQRALASPAPGVTGFNVRYILGFVAESSRRTAVEAMIELLAANYERVADKWHSAQRLRHEVAGQLAEMTGESFGVDIEAWRRWAAGTPAAGR